MNKIFYVDTTNMIEAKLYIMNGANWMVLYKAHKFYFKMATTAILMVIGSDYIG